jgi:hypothetical protein
LFARRTAPREAAQFVAGQLLMMPDPLRSGLAAAHSMVSFTEITGRGDRDWLEICDTAAAGRLPLVMLGPLNSGLAWPSGDVTVSLGSVGLFRRGCGLDLPIAVAVLTADGTLPADPATGAPVGRGAAGPGRARIRRPPLRVPDHRATIAAVTGGGTGLTHIPAGSPARTPTPCPRHGSPKPATAWATGCPGRRGGATATSRAMSWPAPIPPLTTAKPSSTTPSTSG